MLKYQDRSLNFYTLITNVLSTYSTHSTPVIVKKITSVVQNINPTQIADWLIMVDENIELVNSNLRLHA